MSSGANDTVMMHVLPGAMEYVDASACTQSQSVSMPAISTALFVVLRAVNVTVCVLPFLT